MKRKILIGAVVVIVIIAIINILGGKNDTKQTSISQTKKEPVHEVSIAMVTFPGYGPLYLAKEKGFFDGVNVDLKRIEDLGDIRAAVNSGDVDMYAATYDMYQSIKGQKPKGIGFLVIDESHGGDGIVVAEDIHSIADFKGKKVGAEPGFPPYLILQAMLEKEGLTLNDVDFQDLPTTDAGNAFVAGKLDVAAIYEPSLSASADAREGSKIFVTSADTPGLIQDLLFANEDFIREHPEELKKIAEGYFKAVEYIQSNPDESYAIMGKAFDVSADEMRDFATGVSWPTKEENIKMFDENSETNVFHTFDLVGTILEKNGETDSASRVSSYEKLSKEIIRSFK